jgi:hypothetical protein
VSGGVDGNQSQLNNRRHCLAGAPHLRAFSHAGRRACHWSAYLSASLASPESGRCTLPLSASALSSQAQVGLAPPVALGTATSSNLGSLRAGQRAQPPDAQPQRHVSDLPNGCLSLGGASHPSILLICGFAIRQNDEAILVDMLATCETIKTRPSASLPPRVRGQKGVRAPHVPA